MIDIIQLLPDSVANQIAAGEVVQRPASVVKELVENSIDSGATSIGIHVKDAGKMLIQVIDNGCGMSATDARMAFERHATSKIKEAKDLFHITTMGFRGEALASIAAVAQVEIKTRLHDSELGTCLCISASQIDSQEACSCGPGTNFMVKNLFFNIPARRKFLKSNSAELNHILDEVQRVALANPGIAMVLKHNEVELLNLPVSNIKLRIVNLLGKGLNQNLIPVSNQTRVADIKGYIGTPDTARKTPGEQFFFVNHRYMRHPYFYKAVLKAYENLIAPDTLPAFFIYFTVDPAEIDVNIHPTKTEIKFENEQALWQILNVTIKEGLGKNNAVPSINFNPEITMDVPLAPKNAVFAPPRIDINPSYNPFHSSKNNYPPNQQSYFKNENYPADSEQNQASHSQPVIFQVPTAESNGSSFFQYKNKYILTSVKSGLMVIDQKRAHERIVYEELKQMMAAQAVVSQKCLYPVKIELLGSDILLLQTYMEQIIHLGFDISHLGGNTFVIQGAPVGIEENIQEVFDHLLRDLKNNKTLQTEDFSEKVLLSMAKATSINYGKVLTNMEMRNLFDRLFACPSPNYAPDGKAIIAILENDDIEKRFK